MKEETVKVIKSKWEEFKHFDEIIRKTLRIKNSNINCGSYIGLQHLPPRLALFPPNFPEEKEVNIKEDIIILHLMFNLELNGETINPLRYMIKYPRSTFSIGSMIERIDYFKSEILASLIYTLDCEGKDSIGNLIVTKDLRHL